MIVVEQENPTLHEALEKNSQTIPTKTFLHYHDRSYTYAQTAELTNGFADFLASSSLGSGAKVGLMLPRVPELILAFLGAIKAGALPVPINYAASPQDITNFIARIKPAVLVIHEDYLSLLDLGLVAAGKIVVVVVGSKTAGFVPWDRACYPGPRLCREHNAAQNIAYLNFTTGSSGVPKGAQATHDNIYWNTRSAVEALGITAADVHLCMFATFAHPHELFARALYTGGSLVLLEEINPKTIIKTINDHGVTCMMGLAPMYDMMVSHCRNLPVPTLRFGESGGMFTRPDITARFQQSFGIPILSVWGSTETTGIALANRPNDFKTDGSMGKPCPYYEVRIVDEHGEDVRDGEVGELIFKGKGVIAGYDENMAFTARDGWYYSGDMGRKATDGFYYFAERKSGLIKVAGLKVYPLQVENVLLAHPAIREAAVIGVVDPRRGMVPKAFLVVNEGATIDADIIAEFCKGRLAPYMIPKKIQIMESLPKIGSGKINKKRLSSEDN